MAFLFFGVPKTGSFLSLLLEPRLLPRGPKVKNHRGVSFEPAAAPCFLRLAVLLFVLVLHFLKEAYRTPTILVGVPEKKTPP